MRYFKIKPSVWLNNFKVSLNKLINDEILVGKKVTGIIMSVKIYNKLSNELGYKPTDILGYVIEVIEEEAEGSEEIVMIKGFSIN